MSRLTIAISTSLLGVFLLLYLALGSTTDSLLIVATLPIAFVGSILALLISGETWNVSSLVGLIGLFGIAVQNGLVPVTQTRALLADGKSFEEAIREASIGRVRPKVMTAATAIFGPPPHSFASFAWNRNRASARHCDDRRSHYFDLVYATRPPYVLSSCTSF